MFYPPLINTNYVSFYQGSTSIPIIATGDTGNYIRWYLGGQFLFKEDQNNISSLYHISNISGSYFYYITQYNPFNDIESFPIIVFIEVLERTHIDIVNLYPDEVPMNNGGVDLTVKSYLPVNFTLQDSFGNNV